MSLVFSGICSHAPGITGRSERADPALRDAFYASFGNMREALHATRPDALIVVAAEHFANFFMNNMPAYALGMCDSYDGPIEDPAWLRIPHRHVRGNAGLSRRLIGEVQKTVDVAYAEEWRFDHGIMVPLHFLDPENELTVIPAQYQLPGTAPDAACPCLGLRRGASPRRRCGSRAHCACVHRRDLALAGDAGQRHDQRGLGSQLSRSLGAAGQGPACCPIPTRRFIATPGRVASKFALSSLPRRRRGGAARSISMRRFPFSRSAARLPRWR